MLTADHVLVRRRGQDLHIAALDPDRHARALAMAADLIDLARAHLGSDRQSLLDACRAIPVDARDRRLFAGLQKLILDRCRFAEATDLDAAHVRETVFTLAATARRTANAPPGRPDKIFNKVSEIFGGATEAVFDRHDVLTRAAATLGGDADTLDAALFSDLPGAHTLVAADVPDAPLLVALYQGAGVQAVLLRAVKVTARVVGATPDDYRYLFRKLKFFQLLFTLTPLSGGGYVIEIDGPFSLFESVTRYGLRLALAFPAITRCGRWSIEADVRWGKDRAPMRFRCRGKNHMAAEESEGAEATDDDLVADLLTRIKALDTPWQATPATRILDLPGLGVCIPDLEFRHRDTGEIVYFELLGFWSRDAVWRRIELAQAGLPCPVVFGVAKHLRVSEAALTGDHPAALYIFPRTPNARALLDRIQAVAQAPGGQP